MKTVKGTQAVTRFIIQVCCDIYKHRSACILSPGATMLL